MKVYAGGEHPHAAQQPKPASLSQRRKAASSSTSSAKKLTRSEVA
jgi:hypothetical protein